MYLSAIAIAMLLADDEEFLLFTEIFLKKGQLRL